MSLCEERKILLRTNPQNIKNFISTNKIIWKGNKTEKNFYITFKRLFDKAFRSFL